MNKIVGLALIILVVLAGCRLKSNPDSEDKNLTIAVQTAPMTDIVAIAKQEAEKEGYTVVVMVVSDNTQYNVAVNTKEADASFAQHRPFMEQFNRENNGTLAAIQPIYNAIVGFYSREYSDITDIPDGATIAIPSDPSNQARALNILAAAGLITLEEGKGLSVTTDDISENPHRFQWLKVALLNLAEAYNERNVALVFNYPTYIAKLGLTTEDLLIREERNDDFAIQLVAREDNKDSQKIQDLRRYMTGKAVKDFLEENYSQASYPTFE